MTFGELRKSVKQSPGLNDARVQSKASPLPKSVQKAKRPSTAVTAVSVPSVLRAEASPLRLKSSWREEQRNQELQARVLAGLGSSLDLTQASRNTTVTNKGRSSWREERDNYDLRDGKTSKHSTRHNERRTEADEIEVPVPKPPPVPPTAAEMEEIKAKVQQVVVSGTHVAADLNQAAKKISTAFKESKFRHRYLLHSSARTIQTMWRGVGPRRVKEAGLIRLKLENSAATRLQAVRRMVVARRTLVQFKAARKIQTAWRGYPPRMLFWSYQISTAAAIKIQSMWRSFMCYCEYTITVEDIVVVQRVARSYIARQRQNMWRKAIDIQRVFRGHNGRKAFAFVKNQHDRQCGATHIQRVFRGTRDRTAVKRLRMLNCRATTIQKYWRRLKVQQGFWLCIGCVIDIQSFARANAERKRYLSDLRRILMCQSAIRRWLGCRRLDELRRAKKEEDSATIIQTWRRWTVERQKFLQYKRVKAAATKIQAAWRSFVCFSDFVFTISDIVMIQRLARYYIRRVRSATLIQTTWRMFACKTAYVQTSHRVVEIQRSFRGHVGRKLYAVRHQEREEQRALARLRLKSAIVIQSAIRRARDQKKVALIRYEHQKLKAATLMQSLWRSYTTQHAFMYTIGCVIQIQSMVRGFLGRLAYIDDLGSIILSQSAVRRWIAMRARSQQRLLAILDGAARYELIAERHAVTTLQIWFRDVVRPKLHFHAAVKVQSFFRMVRAIIEREIRSEMNRRKQAARRRKDAAIKLQSFWRVVLAIDERLNREDAKHQLQAAIKIQSYFRMVRVVRTEHAKRCHDAATKIQSFFRMVRAMVDREIKAQLKRRKIRKMLRNRTKEIDDLMLEDAWVGMSISNDSDLQINSRVMNCTNHDQNCTRGSASVDLQPTTVEVNASTSGESPLEAVSSRTCPPVHVPSAELEVKASTSGDSMLEAVWKSMPSESQAMRNAWSSMSVSDESVFEAKRTAIKLVRNGLTGQPVRSASSASISKGNGFEAQRMVMETRSRGRSKTPRRIDELLPNTEYNAVQVLRSSSCTQNVTERTKASLPVKSRLPPSYCHDGVTDENPPSEMVRWRKKNDDSDNASEVSALTTGSSFRSFQVRPRSNALAATYQSLRMQSTMALENNDDALSKIDSFTEVSSVNRSVASVTRTKNSHAEKGKRHFRSRSSSREPMKRFQDA
jgi:hypothetical protein